MSELPETSQVVMLKVNRNESRGLLEVSVLRKQMYRRSNLEVCN
jgi:hypothetical protein